MHLESGDRLGRYEIVSFLGKGGMGEVYRARDSELDREVAIKVLAEEVAGNAERLKRFQREAKAVAKLSNANILEIFDFGRQDDVTFAVTELLEGESLRKILDVAKGGLPPARARDIAAAVADGLAAAHRRGVVHRDIKPGNLFRCSDGRIKILDFGLASMPGRTVDDATTESLGPAVSTPGTILGTVGYMSPEQVRGEEVDHRSDIFSLGCVLYEMLTGCRPFQRDTSVETMTAILREDPPSVSETGVEIGLEMEKTLSRCLEKEPGNRFQSAADLAFALREMATSPGGPRAATRPVRTVLRRPSPTVIVVVAVAAFLLGAVWIIPKLISPAEDDQLVRSIAVLPLENLTGDGEKEYFADGATDEIIGQLAQVGALRVISRQSVMRYRESAKLLPEIAKELNVDAVVVGSLHQIGDRVRIRIQLIDALPEEQFLWGQAYEQPMTDVLALYNEIALAIVNEVRITLTPREETRLASVRQIDPEAYEAYLKGMSHVYKLTPPELDAALHYFERALEADPKYALAHAGVSFVWTARQQLGLVSPSEATPRAKEAAQTALELDDTLSEVHYMWAAIKTWNDWDWEAGERAFKRALELNPNHAEALAYYSNLLCYLGRMDEALDTAERAVQLDPFSSVILTISGVTFSYLGRYDDAIRCYQNALETSPNDPVGHNGLWETYHVKGMYEASLKSALAFFRGLGFAEIADVMARRYEEDGYSAAMTAAAETMAAYSKQTYVSPYFIAMMYALAEDKEKSIGWLEMGYEIGDPMMPYVSLFTFDLLDDDPRYHDLVRRLNLPAG